jgi:hypothetical protein
MMNESDRRKVNVDPKKINAKIDILHLGQENVGTSSEKRKREDCVRGYTHSADIFLHYDKESIR